MDHIENKVELRHGAHQLGFQKGGPFLLQSTLSSKVTLETDIKEAMCKNKEGEVILKILR